MASSRHAVAVAVLVITGADKPLESRLVEALPA